MPITMQGRWTVSIKKKFATYAQQFVIAGADSGNGVYNYDDSPPPVKVTGDSWTINIRHDDGTGGGFKDSDMRVKFPTYSGGKYKFDIESDDKWSGDRDFDDLVLSCTMDWTPGSLDYLIYGSVSHYSANCLFNPCHQLEYVVIDSIYALREALKKPYLAELIKKYYPEKLYVEPPKVGPFPDPPPFKPIVLPYTAKYAMPEKQALMAQLTEMTVKKSKSKAKAAADEAPVMVATQVKNFDLSSSAMMELDYDRTILGKYIDQLRPFCITGALPGVALNFQEYDRTAAEKTGATYSGTGNRENLGVCATDMYGNYIFRFSRSIYESLDEAFSDRAAGEDVIVQFKPDVIACVMDSEAPTGFSYESSPYWNIPTIKRINICVPREDIGHWPSACQGEHAIQAIGNIFIGAPQSDGTRVGYSNTLSAEGRITAKSSITGTPAARCAAWGGNLDFYACFLDLPVKYYTIRYSRYLRDQGVWTPWEFFMQKYRHPKIANLSLPFYSGDLVGPDTGVSLQIDGGPLVPAPAYLNIEEDNDLVFTHRGRKGVISSWIYAPEPGMVEFKIEGYSTAGAKIAGAEDTIRLFIDNQHPNYRILDVNMLGAPGGDCALFTLPANQLNAPLTVTFKANQWQGFLQSYGVSVRKGNTSGFSITGTGPAALSGTYVHGSDDKICNQFFGTLDDVTSDPDGVVTANIVPASGDWLEPNQNFCTFAVNLSCVRRVTNGYNDATDHYGPTQYLLGIQK